MRFVIYGVFLALWMGMWVWTYTCHIKAACCPAGNDHSEIGVMTTPDYNQFLAIMAPQLDTSRFLLKSGLLDDIALNDNMAFKAIDIQRLELTHKPQ